MGPLSLLLLVVGVVLIVLGTRRFMPPYRRYQALQEQDANVARYEAWRGGARADAKTGASIAMALLRRQLQVSGLIVIGGFVCIAVAFVLR